MFVQVHRANDQDKWHRSVYHPYNKQYVTECGLFVLPDWQRARLGQGRDDCIDPPRTELCQICWKCLFK